MPYLRPISVYNEKKILRSGIMGEDSFEVDCLVDFHRFRNLLHVVVRLKSLFISSAIGLFYLGWQMSEYSFIIIPHTISLLRPIKLKRAYYTCAIPRLYGPFALVKIRHDITH